MTPWTVARQAPLSIGFCRKEYWNGLPFASPGDLPDPAMEPATPAWQVDSFHWAQGKPGHIPPKPNGYLLSFKFSFNSVNNIQSHEKQSNLLPALSCSGLREEGPPLISQPQLSPLLQCFPPFSFYVSGLNSEERAKVQIDGQRSCLTGDRPGVAVSCQELAGVKADSVSWLLSSCLEVTMGNFSRPHSDVLMPFLQHRLLPQLLVSHCSRTRFSLLESLRALQEVLLGRV